MPLFVAAVREQQAAAGVGADETVLVGFSQGAIMALESGARGHRLARRIVSIAGRFADRPAAVPEDVAFHLLHGADDPVIAYRDGERAEQALVELGTVATIDVLPATGHTVSVAMEHLVVRRLQSDTPSATH
jgi:phospholipase/carboxylesterase